MSQPVNVAKGYAVKVTWIEKIGRYKAVCKKLGLVEYGHSIPDVQERMDASIQKHTSH